jgi:hypothetical protein
MSTGNVHFHDSDEGGFDERASSKLEATYASGTFLAARSATLAVVTAAWFESEPFGSFRRRGMAVAAPPFCPLAFAAVTFSPRS